MAAVGFRFTTPASSRRAWQAVTRVVGDEAPLRAGGCYVLPAAFWRIAEDRLLPPPAQLCRALRGIFVDVFRPLRQLHGRGVWVPGLPDRCVCEVAFLGRHGLSFSRRGLRAWAEVAPHVRRVGWQGMNVEGEDTEDFLTLLLAQNVPGGRLRQVATLLRQGCWDIGFYLDEESAALLEFEVYSFSGALLFLC